MCLCPFLENSWLHAKKSMPKYGARHAAIPGYLAKHMWLQRVKADNRDPFEALCEEIQRQTPFPDPRD